MRILGNLTIIGFGIGSPFVAVEGTAPYTYTVLPGGPGGTITAAGYYTAPNGTGTDVIEAEDSLGEKVTYSLGVLSPLGLLCDIIKTELNLADDQVYIYNQTIRVPPDQKMYIAVGIGQIKPFANNIRPAADGDELNGEQYSLFRGTFDIDIMSATEEALNRKEEVLMSFVSYYSQNQQSANSFSIARITSTFNNLSEVEGSKIPFRFNIEVSMLYSSRKVQQVDSFNSFSTPIISTNS